MCLYTELIRNKKYTINQKNQGNVPQLKDKRVQYVPTPCGNCIECRKQKARSWQARLLEDIKTHTNGKFITLTFSNASIAQFINKAPKIKGYELDNWIAKKALRMFNERYRKEYKKALRHWLVTELGHQGTENIHMHGIIWPECSMEEIEELWKYGYVWKYKIQNGKKINYVTPKTVNYSIKYVSKIDEKHKYYKSIVLTSPGIGANYIHTLAAQKNKFNNTQTLQYYRTSTGHKIALPTYWRNKLYNEEQKEQLWINRLNQQERWICGHKIDISNGEEAYWSILNHHRQKNAQLGYGSNKEHKPTKQKEEQVRIIKQQQRMKNARKQNAGAPQPRENGGGPQPHRNCV